MARLSRVVALGLPHHVTQRGNARRPVFATDADRLVYLDLLASNCRLYHLSILGFCLMSNHVHLIAVPRRVDALSQALRNAHGRYAAYLNAREGGSGHVWQGRYYSCPLDDEHLWAALRYTELNPVRAGMVAAADLYRWSSAAAHCDRPDHALPLCVERALWEHAWDAPSWRTFLEHADAARDLDALRASTHSGRPLGAPEFVKSLERGLQRSLVPRKGGRPRKPEIAADQGALGFV
jgi:putative transposase